MTFKAKFSATGGKFKANFSANSGEFEANFGQVSVVTKAGEVYEGEYDVTPTVEEQVLPTAKKTMRRDLTVKAIPVYNVSNNAGGSTFYIAAMGESQDGGVVDLGRS